MISPGAFRFFLAFVVVVHHSFPLRLGGWAVGLFFVLSGYWISKMWREKYALHSSPYLGFMLSRWWRLAPIYFTVHLLALGLIAVGFSTGNRAASSDWGWWATQPAIVGNAQINRLLPPAWSLDVEMQFYLLAPLLVVGLAAMKRSGVGLLVTAVTSWGALRLTGPASLETPQLDIFLWLFVVGVVCDRFQWQAGRQVVIASAGAAFTLIAVVLLIPACRGFLWRRGTDQIDAASMLSGDLLFFVLCIITIPLAIDTVYRVSSHRDRWLGDLSYPLYLFHWIPRDWYYNQVDWAKPAWWNGGLLLTNFVVSVLGAIVLLHLVDRPLQRARAAWFRPRESRATHTQHLDSESNGR